MSRICYPDDKSARLIYVYTTHLICHVDAQIFILHVIDNIVCKNVQLFSLFRMLYRHFNSVIKLRKICVNA